MIYLVRHGRTEWNLAQRFQGQRDSPLLPEGRRQAAAVAQVLRGKGVTRVFTSPLGRSLATAMIITEALNLEPEPDDRLKECGYGICEGLTQAEIDDKHPGLWAWRDADKWGRAFPQGESYGALSERLRGFVEDKLGQRNICVVSHRGVSRALAGLLLDWPPETTLACHQENDVIFQVADNRLETVKVDPLISAND